VIIAHGFAQNGNDMIGFVEEQLQVCSRLPASASSVR
jgi:hypothetical protein